MKRGFTLIEVLVAMAIIAVLSGILVPAAWRIWETQEVQTTKDRLYALKLAMVGDKSLIQNGIRTSYGFVGDNGELPFGNMSAKGGLKYLISNPAPNYPTWNGPYMTGFDPTTYSVDAWGRLFRYTLRSDLDGYGNRHLSGEIRSAGPNGVFESNGDDIFVELNSKEVAPTSKIKGNIVFSNLTGYRRAGIVVKFRDPLSTGGEITSNMMCTSTFPNFSSTVRAGSIPMNLPIGKTTILTTLYRNSDCTDSTTVTGTLEYFVTDNLSWLPVNLPVANTH